MMIRGALRVVRSKQNGNLVTGGVVERELGDEQRGGGVRIVMQSHVHAKALLCSRFGTNVCVLTEMPSPPTKYSPLYGSTYAFEEAEARNRQRHWKLNWSTKETDKHDNSIGSIPGYNYY